MKAFYRLQALRNSLSIVSLGMAVALLSGCGGGGGDGRETGGGSAGESGESIQRPQFPSRSSLGEGTGCFATVLNNATYDAVQSGMARNEVDSSVQCSPANRGLNEDTWHSEEDKRAELTVYYAYDDSSQAITGVYSKYYKEKLSSLPATMTTPVAAICTSEHINAASANTIHEAVYLPPGLSPDAVNASIGCAPGIVERHVGMVGEQTDGGLVFPPYAIYTWHYFDTDLREHAIKVAFREAEGIAVGAQSTFD